MALAYVTGIIRRLSMDKAMSNGKQVSRHPFRVLLFAALLALPAITAAQSRGYILTDLGMLSDSTDCSASGLNNKGQVVGYCVSNKELPGKFSSSEAFVYADGAMTGLGKLPGNDSSHARAINDNGWIIGSSFNAPETATGKMEPAQGFLYRDKNLSALKGLPGDGSILTGINAKGQIVGIGTSASRSSAGFLYDDGNVATLDIFPTAINNRGQIIGQGIGLTSTLLYDGATTMPLDIQAGTFAQVPSAFNDQGQMVGVATLSYGPPLGNSPYGNLAQDNAYLYAQGKVTYLGFLPGYNQTIPRAVNSQGLIVGVATYLGAYPPDCSGGLLKNLLDMSKCRPTINKPPRPFLYADQRMSDLNALLSPAQAAQYRLTDASAINDAGQIAATATVNGQSRAVLLTPVSGSQQDPTQSQDPNLITFQANLFAGDGDGALRAGFEPGPVAGKTGQVFVVALVPTAQGGGAFFMDSQGGWHLFNGCANAPAYTATGPLAELADITLLGKTSMARLGHSDITLYLGYGLAGVADPAGSACGDMLNFKNYLPLATL